MIAKIALGTLLVIAGYVLLFDGANYLLELRRRETLDADLKQALGGLTPEEVKQRCGLPDIEEERDLLFRDLLYRRRGIVIKFIRNGAKGTDWMFTSMNVWPSENNSRQDPRWMFESMPCLK
jgi:hypothetical protein